MGGLGSGIAYDAEELKQIGHLAVTLPWSVAELEVTQRLMGEDYWSYGFKANEHVLETFTRYHHEQGLSAHKVDPKDLFTHSSHELSRI